jgi:hypothetical protein
MSISVFRSDSTPTQRKEGDIWIKQPNQVYIGVDVPGNVWQMVANQTVGTFHPYVDTLSDTIARADFTDGGSTSGTCVLAGVLPVGAYILGTVISAVTGFTGDTSAVAIVGDGGGDTDRYMTSTADVFTTASYVDCGIPSGLKLIQTAVSPTVTVTSNADFTNVAAGQMTVTIYFLRTV